MAVKPIPDGYHSVTPYLVMRRASEAMEYYKKAFGAKETVRMPAPGGKVGHAEMLIGNSHIMLADESPDMGHKGPETIGGTPITLMIYLDNVDVAFPRAIAAGGKEVQPLKTQFYGDRSGTLKDPFGHVWILSQHVEDVAPEEMKKRMDEMMKQAAKS